MGHIVFSTLENVEQLEAEFRQEKEIKGTQLGKEEVTYLWCYNW